VHIFRGIYTRAMLTRRHWSPGAKPGLVAAPFLLLALLAISVTLWVSWQLDGEAAAVNEAGRMRMQAYRMALAVAVNDCVGLFPRMSANFAAAAHTHHRTTAVSVAACVPGTG